MTPIPDLTPLTHPYRGPVVLAVGWLGRPANFPRGPTPKELLYRLWEFVPYKYARTLGIHSCEICGQNGDLPPSDMATQVAGSAEIRVFWQGITYAAPDMVTHYVRDHHYLPPAQFIQAVLEGPQPATAEYEGLLLALASSTIPTSDGLHPALLESPLTLVNPAQRSAPAGRPSRPLDARDFFRSQLGRNASPIG